MDRADRLYLSNFLFQTTSALFNGWSNCLTGSQNMLLIKLFLKRLSFLRSSWDTLQVEKHALSVFLVSIFWARMWLMSCHIVVVLNYFGWVFPRKWCAYYFPCSSVIDFLDFLAVRNDSRVLLCYTPLDTVANSDTGLEAWEAYKGREGGAESKTQIWSSARRELKLCQGLWSEESQGKNVISMESRELFVWKVKLQGQESVFKLRK